GPVGRHGLWQVGELGQGADLKAHRPEPNAAELRADAWQERAAQERELLGPARVQGVHVKQAVPISNRPRDFEHSERNDTDEGTEDPRFEEVRIARELLAQELADRLEGRAASSFETRVHTDAR